VKVRKEQLPQNCAMQSPVLVRIVFPNVRLFAVPLISLRPVGG
jgi:hypothetical protein